MVGDSSGHFKGADAEADLVLYNRKRAELLLRCGGLSAIAIGSG